jgi:hypothetical protein
VLEQVGIADALVAYHSQRNGDGECTIAANTLTRSMHWPTDSGSPRGG